MNRELSENLTSEVFIRVYKNIRKTNLNRRSFAVWIYRIANNILIDHFKKKNRSYEPIENVIDSIHVNDKEVLKQNSSYLRSKLGIENKELMSALDILTGLQKDIIILRFVEDFDYETIAKIYKKTKGTVRGIVFRAIERLRKEMTKVNL